MQTGDTLSSFGDPTGTDSASPRHSEVRSHLHEALGLLLQANEYALELEQDVWDFAVELHVLRGAKLTNSDLRWLIGKGFVEHAIEITGPNDSVRCFRRTALLTLADTTCVVLTRAGVAAAREACSAEQVVALVRPQVAICGVMPTDDVPSLPKWDCQRRQLRVAGEVVKEFKLPSPNQEMILTAFEEDGWPPRIDDPLPPQPQLDPRRRLHDTIKSLNRKQKNCLMRFMGDGSGEGVRWEMTLRQSAIVPPSVSREQRA